MEPESGKYLMTIFYHFSGSFAQCQDMWCEEQDGEEQVLHISLFRHESHNIKHGKHFFKSENARRRKKADYFRGIVL